MILNTTFQKKSIADWTMKLDYKKDRIGMGTPENSLGCSSNLLSLFSVC